MDFYWFIKICVVLPKKTFTFLVAQNHRLCVQSDVSVSSKIIEIKYIYSRYCLLLILEKWFFFKNERKKNKRLQFSLCCFICQRSSTLKCKNVIIKMCTKSKTIMTGFYVEWLMETETSQTINAREKFFGPNRKKVVFARIAHSNRRYEIWICSTWEEGKYVLLVFSSNIFDTLACS